MITRSKSNLNEFSYLEVPTNRSRRRRKQRSVPELRDPQQSITEMNNNNNNGAQNNGEHPPVGGNQPLHDPRPIEDQLQTPFQGVKRAIVIPDIQGNNFEINHGVINLISGMAFHGFDHEDPHAHIRNLTDIAETIKFNHDVVKMKLFSFSLKGAARAWLDKEPHQSIHTWDDLASKFLNKFCPPSKTSNLRSQILRFQQAFDESFNEAWDRFKELLEKCPNHGFSEMHQIDTFYNGLNPVDQDSLNSAAGGNLLS